MEPGYDGSSAQLALRVLNARASAGFIASPAEMYRRIAWQRVATCDPETRELTLSIQVADNAETIALAVLMTGDGLARFGPITIDTGAAWDAKTADLEVGDGAG